MDLPIPAPAEAASPPPFLLQRPLVQASPVILASPHSGRHYPLAFLAESRLDPVALRRSEDGFVEELFAGAPALGAPLLAATFPRVYCDANREPWELDPGMFDEPLPDFVNTASPRVGAGLGTIARVVASGESVYRRRLSFAEAVARIRDLWEPYHAALDGLIHETVQRFGCCLLIDCHSMPSFPGENGRAAEMILGDAHGTSAAPRATRILEETLTGLGYRLRRNDPYAGGYVTRHYGRPREGVHAIQLEIARSLYMDERRIQRLPGLDHLRADMDRLVSHLVAEDWSFLRA
ncbi:N-formylglutamate amidohydrolase [Roseomonas sp. SSH11]|uniref:N-formylglutamate amidohydrolase n=1 Tax=Pararoseomonas baculiformis TaxID=2820812 RepID=A0ABS4AE18_9PROT|nr:N-formylglutamate amidohydrolase [Pararoseomonas baculiformis]MBP0445245.1 N-formylglutamate amidohydrolase [Pararoseomonas baculiformis]